MVVPVGSLVNAGAVLLGSWLGMAAGSVIPERMRTSLFQTLGICTLVIGINMAMSTDKFLPVIIASVLGVVVGELLSIAKRLDDGANQIKKMMRSDNEKFSDGLVIASVLFCSGAMGIVGAFEEGLGGGSTTLFSKSILDFCASIMLASVYGSGVGLSSVPILIYQGSLTLLAGILSPYMTDSVKAVLTGTGGIMIIGIAFNLICNKAIPISNLLPGLIFAVLLGTLPFF